jgi:hypothetical protein
LYLTHLAKSWVSVKKRMYALYTLATAAGAQAVPAPEDDPSRPACRFTAVSSRSSRRRRAGCVPGSTTSSKAGSAEEPGEEPAGL